MSLVRFITASTLAFALMVGLFVTPAMADTTAEQNQKLEQEIEIKCETGAYGQNTKCEGKGKQTGEQSQKIKGIFRNGKFIPAHQPVDTGLDGATLAVVAGLIVTGSAAAYVKFKTR